MDLGDLGPAAGDIPAPTAIEMARELHAAIMHLGRWHELAQNRPTPSAGDPVGDGPGHPLPDGYATALLHLCQLREWTDRTACAGGAVPALPSVFAAPTNPEPPVAAGAGTITHLLTGPVPHDSLVAYADRTSAQAAPAVVPGSPAATIWDAYELLNEYSDDRMFRTGDSPADLAAALDGLLELADAFAGAADQLICELTFRLVAGTVTGGNGDRLASAAADLRAILGRPGGGWWSSELRTALTRARAAIRGIQAAVPDRAVPPAIADQTSGRSAAEVRYALGTLPLGDSGSGASAELDHAHAHALAVILTYMHATDAETYDPTAHAAALAHPSLSRPPRLDD